MQSPFTIALPALLWDGPLGWFEQFHTLERGTFEARFACDVCGSSVLSRTSRALRATQQPPKPETRCRMSSSRTRCRCRCRGQGGRLAIS
jgi:hypothetical protein